MSTDRPLARPGRPRGHLGVLESNLSGSGFEGLRVAHALGQRITFFTRDLQRYLDVPGGARYFDEFVAEIVECETNEVEAVLETVARHVTDDPFDGFLTMGEYDVVVAAEVAHKLGLPTADPQAIATARNKVWMRQRCGAAGVPMPAFRAVSSVAEVDDAVAAVGLPCVVKPADETSSADVLRCSTVATAREQVAAIFAKPANTRGQARFEQVLVEQCVAGYEVSVEVMAEGGEFAVLGVTDKTTAGVDTFVEVAHVFPSRLPADVVAAVSECAVAALRAVGFDLGLAHVEVKVTAGGPQLIEINPRPAGGRITELIDRALGISCLELVVRQYLGERVLAELTPGGPASGAAIRFLTAVPGRVTAIAGLDRARALPGVEQVVVGATVGGEVRALRRNADRLGHVLAVGPDSYTASRVAEAAAAEISIRTEPIASRLAVREPAVELADLIGSTPLVRLDIGRGRATVLAKLENFNPMSSSKDRAALYMLRGAESRGELVPGKGTIIEATSGNTGIALASLAAAYQYPCIIVLPDSATRERMTMLRALGARVELTPGSSGYPGAIERALELQREIPGAWFACQHENDDNVRAHFETTGPEIWRDTRGEVDVLVCGVGTGATLTGAGKYIRQFKPDLHIVAVEPAGSPLLSGGAPGTHRIPGLNGGFIAPTTDVDIIDRVVTISDEEALSTARALGAGCGLLVGLSSGAAAAACSRLLDEPWYQGRTIVAVFPDTGERYLTIWDEPVDNPPPGEPVP